MGIKMGLEFCIEESIFSDNLKDISSEEGTLILVYDIIEIIKIEVP